MTGFGLYLVFFILGVIAGAWAMHSDIMMQHKEYFMKQRERKEWENR